RCRAAGGRRYVGRGNRHGVGSPEALTPPVSASEFVRARQLKAARRLKRRDVGVAGLLEKVGVLAAERESQPHVARDEPGASHFVAVVGRVEIVVPMGERVGIVPMRITYLHAEL